MTSVVVTDHGHGLAVQGTWTSRYSPMSSELGTGIRILHRGRTDDGALECSPLERDKLGPSGWPAPRRSEFLPPAHLREQTETRGEGMSGPSAGVAGYLEAQQSTADGAGLRGVESRAEGSSKPRGTIVPHALAPGDRVALIAPASPADPEYVRACCELLTQWDLVPVLGRHVSTPHPRAAYLAGTDSDRAQDLQDAWMDPSIAAVICLRGGYGSLRIIDHLNFDDMKQVRPKLFVGSSDITALHQALRVHLNIATLFAPMPGTTAILSDPEARSYLKEALFAFNRTFTITHNDAAPIVQGQANGVLTGGNLSLIAAQLSSPEYQLPPEPIGLLEEIHEEPYRLDLLLMSLQRAGWFAALKAIALGSWEDCGPESEVRQLLEEYVKPLGIPAIWNLNFGHSRGARSVPLGVRALLTSGTQGCRVETMAQQTKGITCEPH